jgi:predicted flap endonuclease-1-like 5' DNA nuclease
MVVTVALALGVVMGLVIAKILGAPLGRRRLLEVHAARGEAERRARQVGAVEARLQEQERAIRYLEEELDAKDLLSRGLKSGFDALRDRLTLAERELAQRSEVAFQSQLESDDALAALWERVDYLTPLAGQLPHREAKVEELESALEAQRRAHENLVKGLERQHEAAQREAAEEAERLRGELAAAQSTVGEHEKSIRELEAQVREHRSKARKLRVEFEEHERQGLQLQLLATEADRTASQIRQLEREHEEELSRRDAEVERLTSRVAELELVERRVAEQEARIRELQVLECQLKELEGLDRRLREREWKLTEAEREQGAAAAAAGGNGVRGQEAEALRRRVGELEPLVGRLAERDAEVRSLEAAVQRLRDRAASQAAELDRRTVEYNGLRQRLAELETEAASPNGERSGEAVSSEAAPAADVPEPSSSEKRRTSKRRARPKRAASQRASNGRAAATNGQDDLKRIRGIGPAFERKLNRLGCHNFRDIAAWRTDDVERVAHEIGASPDKIRGEWIRQAKKLARRGAAR